MKTILFTLTLVISSLSFAKDISSQFIDEAETKAGAEDYKPCAKANPSNVSRRIDCMTRRHDARVKDGFVRGTQEYCEKNYLSLAIPSLQQKYSELKKLSEEAPMDIVAESKNVTGDKRKIISQDDFETEMECVLRELKKRNALPKGADKFRLQRGF